MDSMAAFLAHGDDRAFLAALRAAVLAGTAELQLDPVMLSHPHCPVAGDAYSTQVLYLTIAASFASGWLVNWGVGLAVLAAALLLYRIALRRFVVARMQRYAAMQLFVSPDKWRAMWRFGGVVLKSVESVCAAPEGDWRGFVASLPRERI